VFAKMVSLAKLLSSCIDASRLGCEVIRTYHSDPNTVAGGRLKEAGDARSVVTQADVEAQKVILGSLRQLWGSDLHIIGEEEEDNDDDDDDDAFTGAPLQTQLLQDHPSFSSLSDDDVPMEELVVFVDPLDGTREFVEGRLHNVACLVGIARHGRALCGVVGIPFSKQNDVVVRYAALLEDDCSKDDTMTNTPAAIFGMVPSDHPMNGKATPNEEDTVRAGATIFTGDSNNAILQRATAHALALVGQDKNEDYNYPVQHIIMGGTAAKLVQVTCTPNSMAVLHFVTELWDTCATEALVHAHGGKVTDMFGSPLVHSPTRPYGNIFGVVASSRGMSNAHDALCDTMRRDRAAVDQIFHKWMGDSSNNDDSPQAMDVARDLDGLPLDKSWLEKVLQKYGSNDATALPVLKGYSVPESDAVRGLMSTGCRIHLQWEEDADKDESDNDYNSLPRTVFYKRVVMSDLAHARSKLQSAPHKLTRDVKSYQVETAFLTSAACQQLIQEAGVRVNRVHGSDLRPTHASLPPREQLESRFALFLEDFSVSNGWTQEWLLQKESSQAALRTFANLHGYFWQGSHFWTQHTKAAKELEESVWSNGGYMQPALQGYDQLELVASGWKKRLPSFEEELKKIPELSNVDLSQLGERLERVAKKVGAKAHPFHGTSDVTSEFSPYRTFIHGDPKQANIFLRESSHIDGERIEVGLIDFQWSGFGLAATDVAHHICAAVQPNCLSCDGTKEKELLDYYYSCLTRALVKFGTATSVVDVEERVFPRQVFQEQYEVALLDICRMVFAYAWRRWQAESQPTAASFNRNAYNKSLPSAVWLIARCSTLLSARENDLLRDDGDDIQ